MVPLPLPALWPFDSELLNASEAPTPARKWEIPRRSVKHTRASGALEVGRVGRSEVAGEEGQLEQEALTGL